ncbi:hypothetical protein [Microseira wollei]|uniref:Uncharacterized protein n=1 Tax=Microseira wollei NIES-4236 TaxID=2530354 RepID=A0AAV3XBG9_9CYAN|nr:hypothetical protein [Microseira wollei]GET38100.1 hypothetical protein MiSe_28540 [Microseira wollei NIES-4236]
MNPILLNFTEIDEMQELLHDYPPADEAMELLKKHNGRLDTTFEELWTQANGIEPLEAQKSIWQVTLKVMRDELCGHEGFRAILNEYLKNPGNAALLTTLVVSLSQITTLPINPAIATIIILYILKVGLGIFCEYTEPTSPTSAS